MTELERKGTPMYPTGSWHAALARAIQHDEASRIREKLEQAYSCYDAGQLRKRRRDRLDELICYQVGRAAGKWLRERELEYDFH